MHCITILPNTFWAFHQPRQCYCTFLLTWHAGNVVMGLWPVIVSPWLCIVLYWHGPGGGHPHSLLAPTSPRQCVLVSSSNAGLLGTGWASNGILTGTVSADTTTSLPYWHPCVPRTTLITFLFSKVSSTHHPSFSMYFINISSHS